MFITNATMDSPFEEMHRMGWGAALVVAFAILNLLLWPTSIVWGAPQTAIDAHTLNQRELLYFYHYEKSGRAEMQRSGLKFE